LFKDNIIELLTKKDSNKKKSKIPAKLDLLQSVTGAVLSLFILFHIMFESSILLGKDSMYRLTKIFEADFLIEGGEPFIISILAFIVSIIFIIHAGVAMRKFPASYKEYKSYQTHSKMINHSDTNLWFLQITTGFVMFFLGFFHLYIMMTQPQNIGPFASSDRIYSDIMWPMYLMLLISVILHAGVGVYRLIIKWGLLDRVKSKKVIRVMILFYLIMGLFSLATYIKIGYQHRDNYGEKYHISPH